VHVHAHGHHHHHHHHDHNEVSGRVLRWSLIATVAFVVVQLGAGLTAGSLALISDAGHNLTDALALGLAMFGVYLQRKPADESRTYGYGRGGVLAAFVNALMLVLLSLYLFYEATHRLWHPHEVHEPTMMAVAGLGIVLNVAIMAGLHRGRHDVNIRAAWLHMLGDALSSVAIIIGAVLIQYTGWLRIDPILSILIGALIIYTAKDVIRESLNILLEGMPAGMQLEAVKSAMRKVPGVLDVHDVHVWTVGVGSHALSCHAVIDDVPLSESETILQSLKRVLADQFHIHHSTVQFEHQQCTPGEGCTISHHRDHA
jgi:cobalt-zinc-cadmium efflux system protein